MSPRSGDRPDCLDGAIGRLFVIVALVLAGAAAALPLLLIFSSGRIGFVDAVSLELIAKEVVATLVGSIGLIAAVPITTGLAALLSVRMSPARLAGVEPSTRTETP